MTKRNTGEGGYRDDKVRHGEEIGVGGKDNR